MKFREFTCHLGASTAAVALFLFCEHEVVRKLADQVLVRADGAGFAELCAEHPWGAADWLLRLLAAANLTWWGGVLNLALVAGVGALACIALRQCRSSLAPFAPWFAAAIFALPTLSLGDQVWLLARPQFPQLQLAMFALLAGCLCAGRRGLAVFAALQFLLVAVGLFGFSDLPAFETMRSAWALPLQFSNDVRSASIVVLFASFAVAAFVKLPAALPRWAHAIPPAVAVALTLVAWPRRNCHDQLKMERAVREGRFEDVLKIAPRKARPERMESAWRILAMFRTDRLDRDLYRFPIIGSHQNTEEEEMIMEGPLYLFHYGLIQPARRWMFETIAVKGWQPQNFRLLGDIALVTGEEALARKNFRELARCPFRGDFAAERLRTLDTRPPPEDAFSDLADVAGIYGVWCDFCRSPGAPTYFGNDRIVERFVYTLFLQLQSCPPPMLKMLFASALLDGKPELIRDNQDAIRKLYPDGRIGPVFLEALK